MAYRNGNYSAFYVKEPFNDGNLGAHSTRDFVYYNLLRAWKAKDSDFPFIDSHGKTYDVRDGSDWEKTLKPRIRQRLQNSKNILLFFSSVTKNSRALREEIEYGIEQQGLPVIAVYPEYKDESDIRSYSSGQIRKKIRELWDKVPKFRDLRGNVPVLHVPMKKVRIKQGLKNRGFTVHKKKVPGDYSYPC